MFVAVARIPPDPAALRKAAAIAGLALPDVSRLLAGTLPRVLVRAASDGDRIAAALEAEGFVAFAAEPSEVPTDRQRVVARDLAWIDSGFRAIEGNGEVHDCPAVAVSAILRGIRLVEASETIHTTERKLALGKALLTGGLALTKKVETTSQRTTTEKEPFLLVQRGDGRPDILIRERRFNYRCLGPALQPAAHLNFAALLARLRALAPGAPFDERMALPGFLAGLPPMALEPSDLAAFLVSRARALGC